MIISKENISAFASLFRQDDHALGVYNEEQARFIYPRQKKPLPETLFYPNNRIGAYLMLEGNRVRVACLDIDDKQGENAELIASAIRNFWQELRRFDCHPMLERSSGGKGFHIWIHWSEPQRARDVRALLREVLTRHKFVEGTKGFSADDDVPHEVEIFPKQNDSDDLSEHPGSLIALPFNGASAILDPETLQEVEAFDWSPSEVPSNSNGEVLARKLASVRSALQHVDAADHKTWVDVALALKTDFDDDGLELFLQYSARSPEKFDEDNCLKLWEKLKPRGDITSGTIFHMAREGGWESGVKLPDKNDRSFAQWMAAKARDRFKHVHENKEYIFYSDEGRWRTTPNDSDLVEFIHNQLKIIEQEAFAQDKKGIAAYTNKQNNVSKMADALKSCRYTFGQLSVNDLDSRPHLLQVANGVVDLKTGKLRDASPDDYLTLRCPVKFDPRAQCPRFEQFIKEITEGDTEDASFLLRWYGYNLTGETREQKLVFHYGDGSNGKSVMNSVMMHILGDYAKTVPAEAFMHKASGGDAAPFIARLVGVRMIATSEVSSGARMNESLIKNVTGEDIIPTRNLFKNAFDLRPRFKMNIFGNHQPTVKDDTFAMWRRLLVFPYMVRFEGDDVDKHLKPKLLSEDSGILNKLVAEAVAFYKSGLLESDAVIRASRSYEDSMDSFAAFANDQIDERGTADDDEENGKFVSTEVIHGAYKAWCKSKDFPRPSSGRGTGMRVKSAYPRAQNRRIMIDGKRIWVWFGLVLYAPGEKPKPY